MVDEVPVVPARLRIGSVLTRTSRLDGARGAFRHGQEGETATRLLHDLLDSGAAAEGDL
ncbi:MAG: hypothetical protein WBY94_06405 [Polyangiaceae bacterium]